MKTLWLHHGDLAIGQSKDYRTTTGPGKVRQDLRCALLEPLGNDRFHPGWGSTLSDYVGLSITEDLRQAVLTEVNRVIGNYAAVQRDKVEVDMISGSETRFSTSEIVSAVSYVQVASDLDSVHVNIGIRTVAGETVEISEGIT